MGVPMHVPLFEKLVAKSGFKAVQNFCTFTSPPVDALKPQYTEEVLPKMSFTRSTVAPTRNAPSKYAFNTLVVGSHVMRSTCQLQSSILLPLAAAVTGLARSFPCRT